MPTVKPVGEPDALIGHVRFDERGWKTECCQPAQATASILDSTAEGLHYETLAICRTLALARAAFEVAIAQKPLYGRFLSSINFSHMHFFSPCIPWQRLLLSSA